MRNNRTLWKIFSFIVAGTFIIICIYLMVGSGDSASILKSYDAVKPDSTSGFSKQLQFLQSYTQTTQDTSLAQAVGMSKEDAEELASGSELLNEAGDGTTDTSNFSALSLSDQVEALKTDSTYNNSYYSRYLKQATIDGHDFVWESQPGKNEGAWLGYAPGTDSVAKSGCFLYASAALVGAEMGKVYTIENMITDLGGTVTVDSSGVFRVSNSPLTNIGGDLSKLNKILSSSGCGKTATSVSSIDESKLRNGTMYVIYATKANGSSTKLYSTGGQGMHWTAVVGVSSSGKYIVLGNGSRGTEIDASEFYNLKYIWEVN